MTNPCAKCGAIDSRESPSSRDSKYYECVVCGAQLCTNCGSNGQTCPVCRQGYLSLRRRML